MIERGSKRDWGLEYWNTREKGGQGMHVQDASQ
jgi:hypothetical protein